MFGGRVLRYVAAKGKATLVRLARLSIARYPRGFNSAIYLKENPDVAGRMDAWDHYIRHGRKEGRQATYTPEDFDQNQYLKNNPDVARAGMDPWDHYRTYGRLEGRAYPRRLIPPWWQWPGLIQRAYRFLQLNGVAATATAIKRRLWAHQSAMADLNATALATVIFPGPRLERDKYSVRLVGGQAFAQPIPEGLDLITELDLSISGESHAKSNSVRILVITEDATVLHSEWLDLTQVNEFQRYPLAIPAPGIFVPRDCRPLLVVHCCLRLGQPSGISVALCQQSRSTLREISATSRAALLRHLRGGPVSSPDRALVFRVFGRSRCGYAKYRREMPTSGPGSTGPVLITHGVPWEAQPGVVEILQIGDLRDARGDRPQAIVLTPGMALDDARSIVLHGQSLGIPIFVYLTDVADDGRRRAEDGQPSIGIEQLLVWSDAVLTADAYAYRPTLRSGVPVVELRDVKNTGVAIATIRDLIPVLRARSLPKVSIVTVLYGKERQLPDVLTSYFRQSYRGEIEIIMVDDCSPDTSATLVSKAFEEVELSRRYTRLPSWRVIRNQRNSGNCISRNVGIAHATGDIVVVIDADCLLNRDFIRSHAEAHSLADCDIVIGPLNIETEGRHPLEYLNALEADPAAVATASKLQDEINPLSFVNCITRNFSIRKTFIEGDLFDPAFSYSADPDSGFGWEDVEMGYRLYERGARIKEVCDAFSVHITHPSSVPERVKPLRSIKNFRKLVEKHPAIALEARRWVLATYLEIKQWFAHYQLPDNEDVRALNALLLSGKRSYKPLVSSRQHSSSRALRILSYRWHVPHQYELYKLPHEFHLLMDLGSPMTHSWGYEQRPLRSNVSFRSLRQLRQQDYDLAIIHFDENVIDHENTNGVLGPDWGAAFRWFMEHVTLPKIAICHGTPQFHGQYNFHYQGADLMQEIKPARERLVEYLGDTMVVCNSHQAQREWRFRRSKVIWHGFDPTEFPPATYERGIVSPVGPLVMSRPHYRGYFLYRQVFEGFPEKFAPESLKVPEPSPLYGDNEYAIWKYKNYVDQIRKYTSYFNPTLRSPMPRARGEPMMCGVVTVSANNHDVDMFIRNGINGFYSNEADELREYLLFLCNHPDIARKIGAEGRRTALDVFNHDRYLGEWSELIRSVA